MTQLLPAILTTGVIIENGGTDAPNSVSACVASGVLRPGRAAAMAAICNFIGAAAAGLLFPKVAGAVSELSGLAQSQNRLAALTAAMLAVLIWTGAAWLFSVPTSESHALLAAMGGAAAATGGNVGSAAWAAMLATAAGSAAAGWLFGKIFQRLLSKKALSEKTLGNTQILLAALGACLHGAQDGQKFMCIFAICAGGTGKGELPVFAVLWCSAVLALGTALCGKKMLGLAGNLGVDSRLRGLAADVGGTAVLLAATAAGIPVSTTHVKTASAAGAGEGGREQRRTFLRLAVAWALTFPACAVLGWVLVPAVNFLFSLA